MGRRKHDPDALFVTVTSRMPGSVARRLEQEAERRNTTRSALVASLVAQGLPAGGRIGDVKPDKATGTPEAAA